MIRSQVDMGRVTVVLYLRADLGRAVNSEKRVLTEVIIQRQLGGSHVNYTLSVVLGRCVF